MTEPAPRTSKRAMKAALKAAAAAAPAVTVEEMDPELRERAARQNAKTKVEVRTPDLVACRVLPKGDGKISMGQHVSGVGELHYERGEVFTAPVGIARGLEDRGYVEIQA
jgi:hypothetical protein